jgi:acetyl-CoA carboxylase carboxyl transferase subunit alpha
MKHQLDFEKPIAELQRKLEELRKNAGAQPVAVDLEKEIAQMEKKLAETLRQTFSNLTPWQRVQLARHPKRPFTLDYLGAAFTEFTELHGDRLFAEDRAVVGGFAKLGDHKVVVIGTQKGRDTKENIRRNFGSAHPEGYRKALRLMRLADKFGLPIITLIDTAGAYPGIGAEERHIAEAIAVNLREMILFNVPILAVVIGEGGSGGALGIGVADRVLLLENAYYSVISPEGCAAILWKDRSAASKAAEALKITAGRRAQRYADDGRESEGPPAAEPRKAEETSERRPPQTALCQIPGARPVPGEAERGSLKVGSSHARQTRHPGRARNGVAERSAFRGQDD